MIHKVYTIFDSKTLIYSHPFLSLNQGSAYRSWTELAVDSKSQVNKYPADFTLFEIGTYDDSIGQYEMLEVKKSLGNALECLAIYKASLDTQSSDSTSEFQKEV